jgi:succinate dehydrogenase / fumarate reductase membrane anchor subunit
MAVTPPRTRTPLALIRGAGAAHAGTEEFWRQRLTAAALLPLAALFIGLLIALAGADHATVAATLANGWIAVPLLLMILACIIHMRIGMREIINDYVHTPAIKLTALLANTFFSYAMGIAAALAVIKLSFGI